jgi:hypothetical protein
MHQRESLSFHASGFLFYSIFSDNTVFSASKYNECLMKKKAGAYLSMIEAPALHDSLVFHVGSFRGRPIKPLCGVS